jgi:hypothetical protein
MRSLGGAVSYDTHSLVVGYFVMYYDCIFYSIFQA